MKGSTKLAMSVGGGCASGGGGSGGRSRLRVQPPIAITMVAITKATEQETVDRHLGMVAHLPRSPPRSKLSRPRAVEITVGADRSGRAIGELIFVDLFLGPMTHPNYWRFVNW
jgi:hypothetical protein